MRLGLANLSFRKPSQEKLDECAAEGGRNGVNHLIPGASEEFEPSGPATHTSKITDGWFEDYNAFKVGDGKEAFAAARSALREWQHMSLGWVETNKPVIKVGSKVCIAAKMLCFWQRNPLEVVFINDRPSSRITAFDNSKTALRDQGPAFEFGQTTLEGHALAGEEKFRLTLKPDDSVWYEIYAFSRARTILALAALPIRRFYQNKFRQDSGKRITRIVGEKTRSAAGQKKTWPKR